MCVFVRVSVCVVGCVRGVGVSQQQYNQGTMLIFTQYLLESHKRTYVKANTEAHARVTAVVLHQYILEVEATR